MSPDEIMRMPMIDVDPDGIDKPKPGDMLIFVGGRPPIYGKQRLYFLDKELADQSAVTPPRMPDFTARAPSSQHKELNHAAA